MKELTIGIPTYNGAPHIREAIDSIIFQIPSYPNNTVDILISDNASTDTTREIVSEYLKKYPKIIQYRRNEVNLGFDKNVDLLFKEAQGDYVWLLGDDDALYNNSINHILDLIKRNKKLGVIQANFDKYDEKLEKVIEEVKFSKDLYCANADTFLYNCKGRWGAIASLIIKKNTWNSLNLNDAFGTQTIFGYGLFKILLLSDSYIVKKPLIKVRDGSQKAVKNGDGDTRITIALSSGTLYKNMPKMGYSKSITKWHLNADRNYAYESIPIAKLWGIKDKKTIIKKLIEIHNSPILWLKWIPTILLPDFLYRSFYFIRKKISKKAKPIEKKIKTFIKKSSDSC
ncbi:glycosyltransferase family 2 protein [Rhodoferax fermentans]|uniref:Glycosyltransferase 2-like domain-containing protein n=1 Tax=Rhodoferax fermentans TaxID=28066 RepID=A0A1T1AV33_RHOFE|nr:glycosyltransferase family 2 protein [Rhodoferax fermentans]MBK1681981.1 glycosyltransferase family 2 protein [Rhodoferax fermentans]OOV07976.1 hypothetical protein RF819_15725 [Rhodoferax fermentans]